MLRTRMCTPSACKLNCPDTSEVSDADARGEEGLSVVHVQCDPAALSQDGLGVLGELAQHRDGVGRAYGAERLRRLVPHLVVLGRGLGP